jgi:hypothetical protein
LAQAASAKPDTTKQADSSASKPTLIEPKGDTVKLTGAAQARFLKHQGQTVAQIALTMGLDAKIVTGYIAAGATKQAATSTPTAAPTVTATPQNAANDKGSDNSKPDVQKTINKIV